MQCEREGEGTKEKTEKEQRLGWSERSGAAVSRRWLQRKQVQPAGRGGPESQRALDGLVLKSALWGPGKRNEPPPARPNERAAASHQQMARE